MAETNTIKERAQVERDLARQALKCLMPFLQRGTLVPQYILDQAIRALRGSA